MQYTGFILRGKYSVVNTVFATNQLATEMIKYKLAVTLASTKVEVHVRLIYLIILCHTTELTPRFVCYLVQIA